MSYYDNGGIDFSKLDIAKTRVSLSSGGDIILKSSYNNPGNKRYKKSVTRQIITPEIRTVIIECIKDKVDDYDVVLSRLESRGLDSVKESYWDMALRAFSYLDINSERDVDEWINNPKDIKFYKECV